MKDFFNLKVDVTHNLIGGQAISLAFEVPADLKQIFSWKAGQHITVRFQIDNKQVRRAYSISSSPSSGDPLTITVKRVNNGVVSNHINDNVQTGDEIEVMPPFGGFILEPSQRHRRTHYFFAAGSGITPLFSMIVCVLCAEPQSIVYLAYGNKNDQTILFKEKLEQLSEQHKQRLTVLHVLSDLSMWSGFKPWRNGILDDDAINALIDNFPPYAQDVQYYICGPGSMNKTIKTSLMKLDVPADRIHMESYGGDIDLDESVQGIAAQAQISLSGKSHTVDIGENQSILEAARNAGLTPPFSCQSGVCGACRAQLNQGSVHMRTQMALDSTEVEKGVILTCQSVATSEHLQLTYDH